MNLVNRIQRLAPVVALVMLTVGGIAFLGCKSNADTGTSHSGPSDSSMSGTGGGNGAMGENPARAMHGNPADTQPAKGY